MDEQHGNHQKQYVLPAWALHCLLFDDVHLYHFLETIEENRNQLHFSSGLRMLAGLQRACMYLLYQTEPWACLPFACYNCPRDMTSRNQQRNVVYRLFLKLGDGLGWLIKKQTVQPRALFSGQLFLKDPTWNPKGMCCVLPHPRFWQDRISAEIQILESL